MPSQAASPLLTRKAKSLAGVIALREGRPVFNQEMGVMTDEGVTWINVSAALLPPKKEAS